MIYYLRKTIGPVIRKFFPLDKNYLLEDAQMELQDQLLIHLVEKSKITYELIHNPLGLPDSLSTRIKEYKPSQVKPLYNFYYNLAAVYRFKFGQNQLEFVWDGRDHKEKYKLEWSQFFEEWISRFCKQELFLNAVFDLSVFLPENRRAHLAENRMNYFILQQFEIKILKNKGIVEMKVA